MNHVLFFSLTGKRWERALWPHRVATFLRMNDWDAEVVDLQVRLLCFVSALLS
jgi:hypothetical protein